MKLLLFGVAFCRGLDFIIDKPKLRWFPSQQPMVLEKNIKWTGDPDDFREYHLAPESGKETIISFSTFFKEHKFEKERETYWFGRKEKVSHIVKGDSRYNITINSKYTLFRTIATTSTYDHTFEEWKEITNPRPPHPEALSNNAFMFPYNRMVVNNRINNYMWFNPIMWGVKGKYTVTYKFGFSIYSNSEDIEVYFPLKLKSGQLSGLYGISRAYEYLGEWKLD